MDIRDVRLHDPAAWEARAARGNPWTRPASAETAAAARNRQWQICPTATKPVPRAWFRALIGSAVVCLAAAGANVAVLDSSSAQLGQDRWVAEGDGLDLTTVRGDMADQCMFSDVRDGLNVHPVSNT